MFSLLICSVVCAICANVVAEVILADNLQQPFARLSPSRQRIRLLRWVLSSIGCLALGLEQVSTQQQALFALFSVSAATDLETKVLPPDWFLFGSVMICLATYGWANGWLGLQRAILAQAFCFGVVTLGVALFNVCDSGDIKLAMQFGAACGSLTHVLQAAAVVWLAAVVVIVVATLLNLRRTNIQSAIRQAATLQPAQGPLLWCGLLAIVGGLWP